MAEKVYTPTTISETPFPNGETGTYSVTTPSSGGIDSPAKSSNNSFPYKRTAVELLSTVLNTKSKKVLQEFELVDQGAFRVGKYQNGVSGEMVMTPAGITARNTSGVKTFSISGEDGSAVFAGEVQAGSIISGEVKVGDGDIVIDGEEKRMIFYDPDSGLASIIIGNA